MPDSGHSQRAMVAAVAGASTVAFSQARFSGESLRFATYCPIAEAWSAAFRAPHPVLSHRLISDGATFTPRASWALEILS